MVCILPKDKRIQAFFDMKKQRYPIFLWYAIISKTVEPKHPTQHPHAEKSFRIEDQSDMADEGSSNGVKGGDGGAVERSAASPRALA